MSVVIETTSGDITVDLFIKERPTACLNFSKLCKIKYYNYNLFHTVSRRFIAQTGDPTGTRNGGESIFGVLEGPHKRFFGAETNPRIKHTVKGLISFVGNEDNMIGSQFFFTLGDECDDLTYLDDKHCVFGEVAEGLDVVELINEAICDTDDRPYQDIRITHTVVLDDPLPDLDGMFVPSRSPSPSAERLQGGRIAPDEEIDEIAGKTAQEVNEMIAEREAKARATILEMVGDLPDADMAPPENVLFVCKLNPVTSDDDLEIIFSRFGKIKSCEVIRDHKTGDSLQYAFIEFEDKKSCEEAYFKMDNVLIDDRRIHVDFSQSVSKVKWMGKGRGVKHFPENGSHKKTGEFEENNRRKNDKNRRNFTKNSTSPGRIERRRNRRSRSRSLEKQRRNWSSPDPRKSKNSNRRSKSPTNEYKKNRDRRESESRNRRQPRSRSVSPKNKKIYKNTERTRTPERRNKNNKRRSPSPPPTKNRKRMSRSSSTSSGSSTPKNKRSRTPKKIKPKTNKSTYRKSRSRSPKTTKTRRSRSTNGRSLTPKDKRNRSPSEKIKIKRNKSSYRSPSRSPEPKRNKTRRRSRSTSSGSLTPKEKRSRSPSVKTKTKKSISYRTNRSQSPEHKTTRNRRRSRSESRSQTPERNKIKSKKNKSGKRKSRSTSPEYKKRRSSSSSSDRSTTRKTKQRRNR